VNRKLRIIPVMLAMTVMTGCSTGNWSSPGTCALIGASLGTVGGMTYASTEGDRDLEAYGIGIGVGIAGGALLGWAWCSLMDYTGTRASAPAKVKTVEKEPDHSGSPVASSLPVNSYALATP